MNITPTEAARASRKLATKDYLFEGDWVTPTITISWRPDRVFTVHCWSCDWTSQSKVSSEVTSLSDSHGCN